MQDTVERLNIDCLCRSLDVDALGAAFAREIGDDHFAAELARTHPGLVSRLPVFISTHHAAHMRNIITAIEGVTRLPAFRDAVLAYAPQIAGFDPGPIGVFMGYDFHLGPDGPQLIEINTNAGGALLNAYLAQAQRACCKEVEVLYPISSSLEQMSARFIESFQSEFRRQGPARPLARIAIVDDQPEAQFLYPEFRLFQRLFERHGIAAVIADAGALQWRDGALWHDGQPIDLIYNRLTDFAFTEDRHRDVRAAYLAGAVAVTPNPRAHALFADKRNLIAMTDPAVLASWGVAEPVIALLHQGIAKTEPVTAARADALWSGRSRLFFKPARGYGSKAAYRGDKLTKRVWTDILAGDYIAQALVQPSGRGVSVDGTRQLMKVDIRNYSYDGAVQLLAARLYQGQTTNMRTPGGGFAPVFVGDIAADLACACV